MALGLESEKQIAGEKFTCLRVAGRFELVAK